MCVSRHCFAAAQCSGIESSVRLAGTVVNDPYGPDCRRPLRDSGSRAMFYLLSAPGLVDPGAMFCSLLCRQCAAVHGLLWVLRFGFVLGALAALVCAVLVSRTPAAVGLALLLAI